MSIRRISGFIRVASLGLGLGIFGAVCITLAASDTQKPTVTTVVKATNENIPSTPVSGAVPAPLATQVVPAPIITLTDTSAKVSVDVSVAAVDLNPYASWTNVTETDTDAQQFLQMLISEWSKYPADFNDAVDLRHIYLVKDLRVDGQFRAAMPDPISSQALYYDVSSKYVSSLNSQYMRRVIHHEYAHYIEYARNQSYTPFDSAWLACNVSTFMYGNGGASAYSDPVFANTIHPHNGFITGYAESAIEEDKAEVFAWLMTNAVEVKKRAVNDANLSCKLSLTSTFMASYNLPL